MNTRPGDDIPQPPPPPDILPKFTNILTDSGPHRPTSGSALQGSPPFAARAINALSDEHLDSDAGANPAVALGQPSRWREPRPTDNRISAIPGAASRSFQIMTELGDANQFDVELGARSRARESPDASTQSASVHTISSSDLSDLPASKEGRAVHRMGVTNLGPILSAVLVQLTSKLQYSVWSPGSEETKERKEPPFIQVDLSRERTVIRPRSEQVDRTASGGPSAKPSMSSPPLKRPSASTSPFPSFPETSLESSRMLTPRRTLPYESQAPPRGTLFESPHPGEDREKARPDEQGRNPSAKPPEHTPATTDPPTLPQPVSGPCRSVGTNSPIQLNDEVDRGAEQAMKGPSSERNERKRVTVPEEHENRPKDCTNTEPNSATGYDANAIQYFKALPDTSDPRAKMGRSPNSALSLECPTTPPSGLVPTQNQPRDVIRVRSINNGNSIVFSSTNCWPRHQRLRGDSQALATVTPSNTLNAPSTLENGRGSQAQPGLYPPKLQHFFEQPVATEMSFFQYHPHSSTGCHGPSSRGDTKQIVFSDSEERSSTPSTGTSSEAHDVSVQPVPLEINHPLAPENRQGEGPYAQPDSLDDPRLEDEPQGPLRAPMRRGLPLEDGPPPPRLRAQGAQSPEKKASFWCCC